MVRCRANHVHCIWHDGTYNLIAFQFIQYSRASGVDSGTIEVISFAEAFARGLRGTRRTIFLRC